MFIFVIVFILCSPLLIIGIKKFIDLFGYKKSNLEYTEAKLTRTDYDSMYQPPRSATTYTTYGYKKVGTYVFNANGNEYEFLYSSDRDHGYLPEKITACYPKGKPQKAFAEGNTPFPKEFFNAALFIILYAIVPTTISIVAYHFLG